MTSQLPMDKNVKEWRNEDKNTGVFVIGRSEEWRNNQSSHSFHKPEQRKKKQLEILQANTDHGVLQVIRTQLVTKSSSKSNNTRVLQIDPSSKLETLLVIFLVTNYIFLVKLSRAPKNLSNFSVSIPFSRSKHYKQNYFESKVPSLLMFSLETPLQLFGCHFKHSLFLIC